MGLHLGSGMPARRGRRRVQQLSEHVVRRSPVEDVQPLPHLQLRIQRSSSLQQCSSSSSSSSSAGDHVLDDLVTQGYHVLHSDSLGVPASLHEQIYERGLARLRRDGGYTKGAQDTLGDMSGELYRSVLPELRDLLRAPGLVAAVDQILGPRWALKPFIHSLFLQDGTRNRQEWHADDNAPQNTRRMRHHHPMELQLFYFPGSTTTENGPTAIAPFSQYFGLDHEQFVQRLDTEDDPLWIDQGGGVDQLTTTARDCDDEEFERKADANVRLLGWPLVAPHRVIARNNGAVCLMSHNMYHRGTRRRDAESEWTTRPRFMYRFWAYRCSDPAPRGPCDATGTFDVSVGASEEIELLRPVWEATWRWSVGLPVLQMPEQETSARLGELRHNLFVGAVADDSDVTVIDMSLPGGWPAVHDAFSVSLEPTRISAGYRLGSLGTPAALSVLEEGLQSKYEAVRRAALHGLVAAGNVSEPVLLKALQSNTTGTRKLASLGLGDIGGIGCHRIVALSDRLRTDESVAVRAVCASSLGSAGRAAVRNNGAKQAVGSCVDALLECLDREGNRPISKGSASVADNNEGGCPVSSNGAVWEALAHVFDAVRSSVRESACSALVILCTHADVLEGSQIERIAASLEAVVRFDKNVVARGFAMDAFNRLAREIPALRARADAAIGNCPVQCLDVLDRARSWATTD